MHLHISSLIQRVPVYIKRWKVLNHVGGGGGGGGGATCVHYRGKCLKSHSGKPYI